jgi:SAM-dependent methyltransferase
MNLFKPIFKMESFPLLICNGVLHHTSDAYGGFKSIARLVKRNGYILVGLYNRFGRKITDVRRVIFNAFNDRFKFLDPRLRGREIGDVKKLTWFMDQYKHPHESEHTIGEVIKWFRKTGFEFVNSIPKAKAFQPFTMNERLFSQAEEGNWLDHFIVQLQLLLTSSKEGGFFIMIGKRMA